MNIRVKRMQLCTASRRLSVLSMCDKISKKEILKDNDRASHTREDHKKIYNKWSFYDNLIKAMDEVK